MPIELEIVSEDRRPGRHVEPAYVLSDAFEDRFWWTGNRAPSPAAWCRFVEAGAEVARAKIRFDFRVEAPYRSWTAPRHGVTNIDLVAVRNTERGRGIGTAVVDLIVATFPLPFAAFSRDDGSDRFWRSIGWNEHLHAEHNLHPLGCQRLFTFGDQ